jgi:hypothetical protein
VNTDVPPAHAWNSCSRPPPTGFRTCPSRARVKKFLMIFLDETGIPYGATAPIAGEISLGIGFISGSHALRLEGPYLALGTFVLVVATPQILKIKGFDY